MTVAGGHTPFIWYIGKATAGFTLNQAGLTRYMDIGAWENAVAAVDYHKTYTPIPIRISRLTINIFTGDNASTTNCTATLMKNTTATSLVVTMTALTSGLYVSTQTGIDYAINDYHILKFNASTVGNIAGQSVTAQVESI